MTQSEWQGRQVMARGWVTQDQLAQLWPLLSGRPDGSLLALLVERGLLAGWQAEEIRRHDSTRPPSSGSFVPPSSAARRPPPPHASSSFVTSPLASGSFVTPSSSGSFVSAPAPSGPPPSSLPGGRSSARSALEPGAVIAGYTVVEELSRGGMGVVSRVKAPDGRELAMKTLLGAAAGEIATARFEREAKALERLAHPGVVKLHAHGVEDGQPWLVMDLVEGPTLRAQVRQRGPLPLADAVETLSALARALAYCHEIGVVHRDLKPGNVVLEAQSGRPILLDFGLVKKEDGAALSGFDEQLSMTGELIGTPTFMSPEQLEGRADVGAAADAWAFGATLFFVLTGEEPFKARSQAELQAAILNSPAPRPSSRMPDLPPEVDALCRELLSQDPAARPSLREIELRLAELPLGGSRGRSRAALAAVLIGLLAAALWVGLSSLRAAPVIELDNPPGAPMPPGPLELRGRVAHLGVGKIVCGDQHAPIASDGAFRITVPVADGVAEVALEAFAVGADEASTTLRVPVVCDGVAPSLVLEPVARTTTEATITIRCQVDESAVVAVLDQSRSLSPNATEAFEVPLRPWRNRLEVRATDAAGNVGRAVVEVFREAPLTLAPKDSWPALDEAGAGPRKLILKPGTHVVSALIKGEVSIRAAAPGVVLESIPDKDVFELRGGVLRLEGLSIRARGLRERPVPEWQETVDSPTGLRIYEGEATVTSCTFESEGGDGISLAGERSRVTVDKCRFQDVHWTGVYVEQDATAQIRESRFERTNVGVWAHHRGSAELTGCMTSDHRQHGVFAQERGRLTLNDVTVKRATGTAFLAFGNAHLEAVKLRAEDSGCGLNVSKRSIGKIRDLTVKATKNNAVVVAGARVTLTGARIEQAGLTGVFLHTLASLKAKDLTVSGAKAFGIGLKKRSNLIANNVTVEGTGLAGIGAVDKSYVWIGGGRIRKTGSHGVHANRAAAVDLLQVSIGPCEGAAIRIEEAELRIYKVRAVGETKGLVESERRWETMKAIFKPRDPGRVGMNRGNRVVPDKREAGR